MHAAEEELANQCNLNTTQTTAISDYDFVPPEIKEAEEHIKKKIKKIITKEGLTNELNENIGSEYAIRRRSRIFLKSVMAYAHSGGLLALHILGLYCIKYISYKFISNRGILGNLN